MGSASLELPLYFIGFLMTLEAVRAVRSPRTRAVWRGLRLRHLRPALAAIPLVMITGFTIAALLPWTQWGWWSALGGQGSVAFGNVGVSTSGTPPGLVLRVAPFVFLTAILCYLPAAARLEERWFRLGSEHRSGVHQVGMALAFGLAHVVMGIPIAAALAISVTGWVLQREYLKAYRQRASRHDALMASTHAHLAYNLVLIGLATVTLSLSFLR